MRTAMLRPVGVVVLVGAMVLAQVAAVLPAGAASSGGAAIQDGTSNTVSGVINHEEQYRR